MKNYICHHGVKGMKWGIRKAETAQGAKVVDAAGKLIPQGHDKKEHPDYDDLTDDYMSKVVKRKNLEKQYAEAVGELKVKKSKANIAREVFQTTVGILTLASLVSGFMQTREGGKEQLLKAQNNQ